LTSVANDTLFRLIIIFVKLFARPFLEVLLLRARAQSWLRCLWWLKWWSAIWL